ncbi:MAG: hypothetical protein LBS81_02915 [Endomicrobium sp.]|jgi:tryptophan synthase beta chain|nr:hypothetical protein [Endomicrobium sp.]
MSAINEFEAAYNHLNNEQFNKELAFLLKNYAGRPSRLYYAKNATEKLGGAKYI